MTSEPRTQYCGANPVVYDDDDPRLCSCPECNPPTFEPYYCHAEKCPLCNGSGVEGRYERPIPGSATWENCHGCGGQGWVAVPNSI